MSKKPVVVIDSGYYSLSDDSIEGVGLRLSEIAQALSRRYTVQIIARHTDNPVHVGDAEIVSGEGAAERAIAAADAVMFFDTANRDNVERAVAHRKLIIGECRAPIEHMHFPSVLNHDDPTGEHQQFLNTYRRQLEVSHHFICRSRSERMAFLPALCAAGRIRPADLERSRTLDHLISTVPVGYSRHSAELADRAPATHKADFLWTGGVWSWYEPLMFVEALHMLRKRGVDATATFLYGVPVADSRELLAAVADRIEQFGLTDRVTINDQRIPLSERDQYLKAAKAYVCVSKPGAENETGIRLRLRDSYLYGIPSIVDGFGLTGDLVAADNLGIVLPEPSAETLADALQEVASGGFGLKSRHADSAYEDALVPFMEWLDSELADK
ncbi:glycosyltransferase [Streptomyces sp. MW-W600-10]|uniref:glycosyltransferase n=1 Tax=Streptomyces sp. MW-W600-10 TaxID=2829819 RepID=UPI001C496A76|nr:glycosyltransferase [Streptomyces sp. MW-W600-10]MBV7245836.1 glycosyltransferase [Streptomyces sp. MW-W600-10]